MLVGKEKKLYIIFTTGNIHRIGGMEMYINGITKFLENRGFKVLVLSPSDSWGECDIPRMGKYVCGGNELFGIEPALFSLDELNAILDYMMKKCNVYPDEYEEIYIESHSDIDALWAEYFSECLKAKHIALLLNEFWNADYMLYKEYIDFFWHMYTERRLRGRLLKQMFIKYGYPYDLTYEGWAVEPNPVGTECLDRIQSIEKKQWNIAYIGRGNKEYVETLLNEVDIFANLHQDKEIQFLFVGDSKMVRPEAISRISNISNIFFCPIGNLVPIPRILFSKIDVVIANSQTAYFCALEGVPVVTVSTVDNYSSGVLGYDCFVNGDPNYRGEICKDISEALEDVFVTKGYLKKTFQLDIKKSPEQAYSSALFAFDNLKEQSYYDVSVHDYIRCSDYKKAFLDTIRSDLDAWSFDLENLKNNNIVVYGAGYEGSQCVKWLKYKNKNPLLVVDSDESKWGKEVCGVKISSPDKIDRIANNVFIICSRQNSEDIYNEIHKKYRVERHRCTTFLYIRMFFLKSRCTYMLG